VGCVPLLVKGRGCPFWRPRGRGACACAARQGPTISRVYSRAPGDAAQGSGIQVDYFSVTVVVPKNQL